MKLPKDPGHVRRHRRGPHIYTVKYMSGLIYHAYIPVVGGKPIRVSLGTLDHEEAVGRFLELIADRRATCTHQFVCAKCGAVR